MKGCALSILLSLLSGHAMAGEERLTPSYSEPASRAEPLFPKFESSSEDASQDPASATNAYEGPTSNPRSATPAPDPRFSLDDEARLQAWMNHLCGEEPVGPEYARQRRMLGRSLQSREARNKQGSLKILAQNYLTILEVSDGKKAASLPPQRAPSSAEWVGSGPWKAPLTKGKSKTEAAQEQLGRMQQIFRTQFFELRDLSRLSSSKEAHAKLSRLLSQLENNSRCRTRSIRETKLKN